MLALNLALEILVCIFEEFHMWILKMEISLGTPRGQNTHQKEDESLCVSVTKLIHG